MNTIRIAVLGGSGLLGHAIACDLANRAFDVGAYARRFSRSQLPALKGHAVLTPLVSLSDAALERLLQGANIVINCLGVLQDGPASDTDAVHRAFPMRLAKLCAAKPQKLLIHLSIPGTSADDHTPFSRSKRKAEDSISTSGCPYVILRPGFVIAPAAYGGSALIRALAMLPVRFSRREADAPFAAVAINDICETVAHVANRWANGETMWRETWDLMDTHPQFVRDIVEGFREHSGGPAPFITLPSWLLTLGVATGDAVAWLGWRSPIRSTAILEMRRGVTGNPDRWIAQTGMAPLSLSAALQRLPATVQEKWFARLYLIKGLSLVTLVLFWCVSSLIAVTVSFPEARNILLRHGFSMPFANAVTLTTSVMDFLVGLSIAWRPSSKIGLIAGILISLGYMAGALVIAPELWIEPLGALVKTGPAIILMLICLALMDDR